MAKRFALDKTRKSLRTAPASLRQRLLGATSSHRVPLLLPHRVTHFKGATSSAHTFFHAGGVPKHWSPCHRERVNAKECGQYGTRSMRHCARLCQVRSFDTGRVDVVATVDCARIGHRR